MEQFQKSTGNQTIGSQMPGKGLTWVHLPSANDAIKKIYVSRPSQLKDWDQVASFVRASWSQIPDKTSPSRFMRPQYVILHSKERMSKVVPLGLRELVAWPPLFTRGSVIHDAPTLDEHYYHFATDKESQRDRAYRNENQQSVEWLVTSASCAKIDNERTSTFVNAIVDHLRGQVEDGSRERGPNSATELSKVISDYCIGTYDRQQEIQESKSEKKKNGNQQSLTKDTSKDDASTDISGSTARHESKTSEISIRHIFSNFINRIGRQEAELYGQFSGQTRDLKQEEVDNSSSHGNLSTTEAAVKKAAQLLFEIKDVRDELNILRTIAEFQRKVQSRMNGRELTATSPILDEDLTAVYVRNDIDEMDKLAGRIKDAVLYSRRH
ncbi:hypothetical protein CKAH01_11158 [Colletotrichum kahawae]|uniref:Uncharacterized protein n=1 Tax=Colletotrichum kahawae TaxID=34407 RepID=A0AAD9XXC9_COLKA|nr:hypothetical protein CKAH01_11158 [Colletotrichum kahawae]